MNVYDSSNNMNVIGRGDTINSFSVVNTPKLGCLLPDIKLQQVFVNQVFA